MERVSQESVAVLLEPRSGSIILLAHCALVEMASLAASRCLRRLNDMTSVYLVGLTGWHVVYGPAPKPRTRGIYCADWPAWSDVADWRISAEARFSGPGQGSVHSSRHSRTASRAASLFKQRCLYSSRHCPAGSNYRSSLSGVCAILVCLFALLLTFSKGNLKVFLTDSSSPELDLRYRILLFPSITFKDVRSGSSSRR